MFLVIMSLFSLACGEEGILLLEVNRMLRAGGYFVLAEQYVDVQDKLVEQWKGNFDLYVYLHIILDLICLEFSFAFVLLCLN